MARFENQITKKTLDKFLENMEKDEKEEPIEASVEPPVKPDPEPKVVKKAKGWYDQSQAGPCKTVYVYSLPLNITIDKFEQIMSKCGLIAKDPITNGLKLKLYRDKETNEIKGDGICTYLKSESVELALKLIDSSYIDGKKIFCEEARFEMKGEYDPKRSKKKRLTRKQKKKMIESREKLFQWKMSDKEERRQCEATAVIKNCFSIQELDSDTLLKARLRKTINDIAARIGPIRKINIYDVN